MSGYVSGLCYKVKLGCATTKAVAVALADHANDEGGQVFPSVKRLAEKVEVHERTIQRALRRLEAMGILVVVHEGGGGPRDTREWAFDLAVLRDAMDGRLTLSPTPVDEAGNDCAKGDTVPPLENELRVALDTPKGGAVSDKGDTGVTRNVTNLQETSTAPLPPSPAEPQRSGQMNFKNSGRGGPIITIRAGHNGWDAWLDHIEARLGVRQREAAEAFGELDVTTRWPRDETPMPIIGRSA